jgi:hypothetical protein
MEAGVSVGEQRGPRDGGSQETNFHRRTAALKQRAAATTERAFSSRSSGTRVSGGGVDLREGGRVDPTGVWHCLPRGTVLFLRCSELPGGKTAGISICLMGFSLAYCFHSLERSCLYLVTYGYSCTNGAPRRLWNPKRTTERTRPRLVLAALAKMCHLADVAVKTMPLCSSRIVADNLTQVIGRETQEMRWYWGGLVRYALLAPELVGRVRVRNGSLVLATGFESSVRELHVLCPLATRSLGPVMSFLWGTWASARGLTRAAVGHYHMPRSGFSW